VLTADLPAGSYIATVNAFFSADQVPAHVWCWVMQGADRVVPFFHVVMLPDDIAFDQASISFPLDLNVAHGESVPEITFQCARLEGGFVEVWFANFTAIRVETLHDASPR